MSIKYCAFLRGINVGGNAILPMKELLALFEDAGLKKVSTFIQSGNVLFESEKSESEVKVLLEDLLQKKMGKHIEVAVRTETELKDILSKNPFAKYAPERTGIIFFTSRVPEEAKELPRSGKERVHYRVREIIVFYPDGIGKSKLKIEDSGLGTMRNVNTITKILSA